MSEDKNDDTAATDEDAAADHDDIGDAQFPEPEAVPELTAPPKPAGKAGGMVAWLALLLAIVAVGGVGLQWMQGDDAAVDVTRQVADLAADLNNVTTSVGATQDIVTSLEQSVSALTQQDANKAQTITRLREQLDERLRELEVLPGRIAGVEASMASLQGISTGARDAWLLAEAEYYMQIANVQLQLGRNPDLALLALNHADERILQLADPRLTNIRRALADEMRMLEALEKTDTAGITLTLASLAATVESLPLKQETSTSDAGDANSGIDPELTGMDRAMASLRNAVDGVVSIRRVDEVAEPLVAPDAQFFLRANLALQLQVARLALLRSDETIFRASLDDADRWLAEYYDPDNTAVQSARATIASVRGSVFSGAAPDISQSLRLLRQFNTLNGGTGSRRAAPEPEPETVPEPALESATEPEAAPAGDDQETAAPEVGAEPEAGQPDVPEDEPQA
jgi:uncharacterized protein HemX